MSFAKLQFGWSFFTILAAILALIVVPFMGLYSITALACSYDKTSNNCIQFQSVLNGCIPNLTIKSEAEYKYISGTQCTKFKQYIPDLKQAAAKYSNGKLILNEYLIGAIISRESNFGELTNGCDGYGDNGFGHGIAQVDGRFSTPLLGRNGGKGIKVSNNTSKYGNEQFVWSSCKDAIAYIGSHLLSKAESITSTWIPRIASIGVNTSLNDKGEFNNSDASKIFTQATILAYNAGQGGVNNCKLRQDKSLTEGCSTNNYLTGVLKIADDLFECLNNRKPQTNELINNKPSDNQQQFEKCAQNINSLNNLTNVASNFNFSTVLKEFISETQGKMVPLPPPETDRSLDGECVTLVKAFQNKIGVGSSAWAAYYPEDKWKKFGNGDTSGFKDTSKFKVVQVTTYESLEAGDIMIINQKYKFNPELNMWVTHTGLFMNYSKDKSKYTIWDQNSNKGRIAASNEYSKSSFVGAFRYILQ
jgi:hypothetical protein